MLKNIFNFDPQRSLIQLPLFKFIIYFFFVIAAIIFTIILLTSDLFLDLSYDGFNNIFVYFKFPITIIAIIIPIVALIASNHRSEQTKHQLELTNSQNNFSNYYKHLEEFEKYISDHLSDNESTIKHKRKCHSVLFPRASFGDYKSSLDVQQIFTEVCENIVTNFEYFRGGHPETQSDTIINIESFVRKLEEHLYFEWHSGGGKGFNYKDIQITLRNGQLSAFFLGVLKRLAAIETALSFDTNYRPPPSFVKISEIKTNNIPKCDITEGELNATSFTLW